MCNLYSVMTNQDAIRQFVLQLEDRTGNLPQFPAVFPDKTAPIVRNHEAVRELAIARWGMPTPPKYLFTKTGKPRASDPGVTNIRNVKSAHWRRWLGIENRCVVPFTSFAENETQPDGSRPPIWFALNSSRPLAFFAGIWTRWTSVRRVDEGESTNDVFGFLTTDPNALIRQYHPKAMPVILTTTEEVSVWLTAPMAEALQLQRPLPDDAMLVVARGEKSDGLRDTQ